MKEHGISISNRTTGTTNTIEACFEIHISDKAYAKSARRRRD